MKKQYGSLLKDHQEIKEQSEQYPYSNTDIWWTESVNMKYKKLPDSFDGRDIWEAYIQFPFNQVSSESWAIVAANILADRYTIITAGQINLFLSFTEIVTCIGPTPHKTKNSNYIDSTQGYSIYDAWEYIYKYGVPETNCFSKSKLKDVLVDIYPDNKEKQLLPYNLTYSEKQDIYGKKCSKLEGNQLSCLTMKGDKPIARRTFFCNGIFNINGVDSIKYELLRFGPVAAGFIIYENFVNEYDGTTIYDHVSGKALGGHYVSIIGWDNEKGTEYWICRNSWGTNWGLLGFFKIKIGIPEIKLEQNVSACTPFYNLDKTKHLANDGIFKGKQVDITDMELYNPTLVKKRDLYNIDESNFYPQEAIKLIKEGKMYGDLDPLISFPNDLPNIRYYWAENFGNFKYITEEYESTEKESYTKWYITVFILAFVCFYIGYKLRI